MIDWLMDLNLSNAVDAQIFLLNNILLLAIEYDQFRWYLVLFFKFSSSFQITIY